MIMVCLFHRSGIADTEGQLKVMCGFSTGQAPGPHVVQGITIF